MSHRLVGIAELLFHSAIVFHSFFAIIENKNILKGTIPIGSPDGFISQREVLSGSSKNHWICRNFRFCHNEYL